MSTAARVFRWSEMYSVNIATLDRQHQELIDTVHELEQTLRAGKGNGAINHVLEKLVDYATAHFADEESLMEKHDFPELPSHRRQHLEFCKEIEKLIEDYRAAKAGVPVTLWLSCRLGSRTISLKRIKLYSAYLNARGVR